MLTCKTTFACLPIGTTPFKYEYECYNQQDELVAKGEFYHRVRCYGIRSPEVEMQGHFELINRERDLFSIYRGANHLKTVRMKVTNLCTKKSRYI